MKPSSFLLVVISAVLSLHLVKTAIIPLTLADVRNAELAKHNLYRSLHGCAPLAINSTLNTAAQDYADQLSSAHNFAHSPAAMSGTYGENLYWVWGSPSLTYSLGAASTSWYNELKYYDYTTFKSNTTDKVVGHFTAMIWKSAKSVGFGYARVNEMNGWAVYIVANYAPTPNVRGKYAANVPRPI
jgi:glioma pathogenesis-related protein 2